MNRRELIKLAGKVGVAYLVQNGLGRICDQLGLLMDLPAEAASLPRNYQMTAGTPWLDSQVSALTVNAKGNGGTAVVTCTDNTDATYIRPVGAAKSLKLDVTTGGTQTFWNIDWIINESITPLSNFSFAAWTNVTDFTGWVLGVFVSEASNYANRYNYAPVTVAPNVARTGWNTFKLHRGTPASVTGSPAITNTFTRVRFQFVIPANATGTWYIGPVYKNSYNRPKVVFSFDDQDASQYANGYQVLDSYGLPGSQCIQTSFTGGLSVSQFNEMKAKGWSFHSHSQTHPNLTTLTVEAAKEEMRLAQAWLDDRGLTYGRQVVVFPNGATNDAVDTAMGELGYTHGAIVRPQLDHVWDGFEQPRRLNRWNTDISFSLATLKGAVDDAIKYGSTQIFYSHAILDGATGSNTERSTYAAFISYVARLAAGNMIDVPTLQGLIDGMTNPRRKRAA